MKTEREVAKRIGLVALTLALALMAGGCGDNFLNEEMHLGNEEKVRPIAVLVEPAEAAPGETVRVWMMWHDPRPADTAVSWTVALDFDAGLYGTDPKEDHVVPLEELTTVPGPVDEGYGFVTQAFDFVVPVSTLVGSSNLETRLGDEIVRELTAVLAPELGPGDIGKAEVDAWLGSLDAAQVEALDAEAREVVLALADVFATQIRFRATLTSDRIVEVTRNVTVRHSRRIGSPNVNENPTLAEFEVLAIPRADADWDAVEELGDAVERTSIFAGSGIPPEVRVPRREGWTYYLSTVPVPQTYSSPLTRDGQFRENTENRWYFYWMSDPRKDFALFRDDDGEETEMWMLDEHARIEPPAAAGETRFRILTVVRDERLEWERYQFAPGQTLAVGEIVFE